MLLDKYMPIKLLKLKKFVNNNGTLVPVYLNKIKKFKLKRFFILYGKKKYFRSDHAHSKCSQIIIPLSGEILIKIVSKNYIKKFRLNTKSKVAIYVPPYNWVTIYFKNNNDSLLTLCNYKYDKKEYISLYKDFKKIISK